MDPILCFPNTLVGPTIRIFRNRSLTGPDYFPDKCRAFLKSAAYVCKPFCFSFPCKMSATVHVSPSPSLRVLLPQQGSSRDWSIWSVSCPNLSISAFKDLSLGRKFVGFHFLGKADAFGRKLRVFNAWTQEGSLQELDDLPASIDLEPICSDSQFDRIVAEAQQLEEPIIVVWMASWCRKCIYLKPKLEKLAANYYPRLRFYHVDVNNVPHKLVVRAGVTKMPTIQLWKDGQKQDEVIGGHKAYLVVNEVREMIENEYTD